MRAPGSGLGTGNKPPSSTSLCQPLLSTGSNTSIQAKPRPIAELRKSPSAGSVLVATATNRSSKTTTTNNRGTGTGTRSSTRTTAAAATLASAQHSTTTTTTTTTTPKTVVTPKLARPAISSSISPAVSRTPLGPRDKNAAPGRPTEPLRSSPTGKPAMSVNNKSAVGSRPAQMPTLSAQAARGLNKPPLTPKIAARSNLSTPTAQYQTATVVTPLARRAPPRSDLAPSSSISSRDDITSPIQPFLATNVTPRSGSRQSRVDTTSAGSTPAGTPNPNSHDAWETRSGLGLSPAPVLTRDENKRRPVVTFSPPLDTNPGSGLPRQDRDKDSKFFYASDAAKSTVPPPIIQPRLPQPKTDTFFYANGATLPVPEASARQTVPPPTSLAPTLGNPPPAQQQDDLMSKFVYANGIRDTQPGARPNIVSRTSGGSVVSTASKASAPRLGPPIITGNITGHGQQQSQSPVKVTASGPISSVKNTGTSALPVPRPISGLSNIPALGSSSVMHKRRSTGNPDSSRSPSTCGGSHSRQASITSVPESHTSTIPRLASAVNPSHASSTTSSVSNLSSHGLPAPLPTAAGGFASLLQAAEDLTSADPVTADDDSVAAASGLQSPTKSSSQDQALTELVANARRERKVQDLEITTASLEAINRTLERQLRKQTAELRRYRRMSRSGRLSIADMGSHPGGGSGRRAASDGSASGAGALARAGLSLEDLSEEEDSEVEAEDMAEMDDEEDEDDFSPSESGSAELSPGGRALLDEKHRRRDEQRLQLDLSKHQELLVDSQKINQSLRRCLGWTEELIKEGRRALAYKVHVSEIELGGRVLAPEEIEGQDGDEPQMEEEERDVVRHSVRFDLEGLGEEAWSKGSQDRDSGIDLPVDGG